MACCVCHVGVESRKLWLDGDIEVEGEGTYVICALCIAEAARALGMADAVAVEDAQDHAARLAEELDAALVALDEARSVIDVLRRYDAGAAAPSAGPDGAEVPSPASAPSNDPTAGLETAEARLAAVDAELAEGPLGFACPVDACVVRKATQRGVEHHARLKHGWKG